MPVPLQQLTLAFCHPRHIDVCRPRSSFVFIDVHVLDHQFKSFVTLKVVLIRLQYVLMLKDGVVNNPKRFEFLKNKLR